MEAQTVYFYAICCSLAINIRVSLTSFIKKKLSIIPVEKVEMQCFTY